MKTYEVEIIETLTMTVKVEAETQVDAEIIVKQRWDNSEYILGAEHFDHVKLDVKEVLSNGQ